VTFRPVLDENGQTIIQQAPDGRRAVRCLDENGASVWRPLEEFTGRPAVGAEGTAPVAQPGPQEALEVDLEAEAPALAPEAATAPPGANGNANPLCPFCGRRLCRRAKGTWHL
jgi:hypothetical protein